MSNQICFERGIQNKYKTLMENHLRGMGMGYFQDFIRDNSLQLDLTKLTRQANQFLPHLNDIIYTFPIKQIRIFHSTASQKQSKIHQSQLLPNNNNFLYTIIKTVTQSLQNNQSKQLRSIKIENIPSICHNLKMISVGIQKSKYLKKLTIVNCHLNDSNFEDLKNALSQNISLTSIDFSYNQFKQIGQAIVQILTNHGQRKSDLLNLHQKYHKKPQFNISSTGIYKLNLQGNQLTINTIDLLIKYLHNDQWVKSINLKNNQLQQLQISKFISILQQNSSLINLDLQSNPGFNKKCSKTIFCKLKQNLSQLKNKEIQIERQKESPQFSKKIINLDLFQNYQIKNHKKKFSIKSPERYKNYQSHHSQQKSINNLNKNNESELSIFTKFSKQNQTLKTKSHNKNFTMISQNNKNSLKITPEDVKDCSKCCELQKKLFQVQQRCMQMHIQTLKAEKQNLQLEIEIKKLKSFIEKNKDLSLIGMSINKIGIQNLPQLNSQNSNISTSFNKILGSQNDEELISRIQVLVSELTRIMETVEQFQNTQNTIEHPFSNVNSFSKTVSLYERPRQLMQIQQQILEDEALHLEQFGEQSLYLEQRVLEAQQNILKTAKNQITG